MVLSLSLLDSIFVGLIFLALPMLAVTAFVRLFYRQRDALLALASIAIFTAWAFLYPSLTDEEVATGSFAALVVTLIALGWRGGRILWVLGGIILFSVGAGLWLYYAQ